MTNHNWFSEGSLAIPISQGTTGNDLTCAYYLNSEGLPGMLGVCQEKPSGLIKLDYKGDNRWGNFQYFPLKNNGDSLKKDFHDIYIDIEFDGYFDVRFVIDNLTKKAIRRYIMLGMDWEKMESVFVNEDEPTAVDQAEIEYIFKEGSWLKKIVKEN